MQTAPPKVKQFPFYMEYVRSKRDGISRPFFAYFFFRGFGSGVAASAARSTCSVSS